MNAFNRMTRELRVLLVLVCLALPQGVWADIPPLGEPQVHEPVYRPQLD